MAVFLGSGLMLSVATMGRLPYTEAADHDSQRVCLHDNAIPSMAKYLSTTVNMNGVCKTLEWKVTGR